MTAEVPARTRIYWTCQLVGFGLYVVATVIQMASLGIRGPRLVVEPLLAAAVGIGVTHLFRTQARARGWVTLGPAALAPRVILGSLGLALATVAVLAVLELRIYQDVQPSVVALVAFATMRWTLLFLIWTSLYFGLSLMQRRQELEVASLQMQKAQKAAELRALRAQMNPHFPFNSLNSIRALVSDEPARAQDAITELARMLRYTLRSSDEDVVTLDRELETVEDYLALESLRLGTRLVVERQVAPEARAAKLPVMLLLTLVENAIKHGIARLPAGGTLRVHAEVIDGALFIDVDQPRPTNPSEPAPDSHGVGLANVQERLRLLFGDEARVTLDLSEAGHARAHARMPARP